jgi:hypothetical protein
MKDEGKLEKILEPERVAETCPHPFALVHSTSKTAFKITYDVEL